MKKQRKHYTPEEKVAILRRPLLDKEPISKLCDELGLQPTVFYRWQKEFFENGASAFDHLETMARGGGWSFRTWCYSGKSRLMIPHQSVAHCSKPRERNVGTVRRGRVTGRPLDEDTQYGIRPFSARSSNQKHKS